MISAHSTSGKPPTPVPKAGSASERDRALRDRLALDLVPAGPLQSSSDPCAHPQVVVRRVRDRVDLERGDVAFDDLEAHQRTPASTRRNTSAAARWKPSGRPAAAKVEAIASISATRRQPFQPAERAAEPERSTRSGSESRHSSRRSSSTFSAWASARIAINIAAVPFVQAAYAILSAEAAPGSSEITIGSSAVRLKSSATASASAPER